MACAWREIFWAPKLSTNFGFRPTPPGSGSSSLLALIEREFTPWSPTPHNWGVACELISRRQPNVKKRMALGVIFFCGTTSLSFPRWKKHVAGLFTLSAAFFHVQHEVVPQNVVVF